MGLFFELISSSGLVLAEGSLQSFGWGVLYDLGVCFEYVVDVSFCGDVGGVNSACIKLGQSNRVRLGFFRIFAGT